MKAVALLALAVVAVPNSAPISFDMKDPKGVSGMSIKIDSKLEPVRGQAVGVSGNIAFDVANPEKSTGKIVVDSSTIRVGSQALTDAALGEWCLDVKKYPTVEFAIKKVENVKSAGEGSWTADVTGDFTLHGVTKEMKVSATATHLPGMLKPRGGMPKDGDLLRIQSTFKFKRLDFGVAKDLSTDVIGNEIEIDLNTIGVAPK